MRPLAILGVVLILLGIAGLVFQEIPIRHTEEVAKIGPVTATQTTEKNYPIPTYAGIVAVLAGAALIFMDRRRS
ncbi:MAG TPA: hypothetical protein VKU84_03550 [Stellaceae bacterium]|nr:hypothetical protein [Stellaceae bacterium]